MVRVFLEIRYVQYSNKTVHRELDINMTFIDNKAGLAGNSIYANPLYNCSQSYSLNIPENVNIKNLLSIKFESSVTVNNRLEQMSSQPVNICSCKPSNNTSNLLRLSIDFDDDCFSSVIM